MKIALKVSPGAKKSEIIGWVDDYPLVGRVLKLRIAAPASDGKANKALIAFMASSLGIARSQIRLAQGSSSRIKLLELPDEAAAALADVLIARAL